MHMNFFLSDSLHAVTTLTLALFRLIRTKQSPHLSLSFSIFEKMNDNITVLSYDFRIILYAVFQF